MDMRLRARALPALLLTLAAAGACADSATDPTTQADATALLSVQPAAGTADVSVGTDVVITFDHPIAPGMEAYADLHEGTLTGPKVAGSWTRSADGTQLVFTPTAPLAAATTYVIHIGGGMWDAEGHRVALDMHGMMGGSWATASMMTGGMGGMMGGGTMGEHMGAGWEDPDNGMYGMVFTFTTAG